MIKAQIIGASILGLVLRVSAQEIPPAPEMMQNLEPEAAASAAAPAPVVPAIKKVEKKKKKKKHQAANTNGSDEPDLQKEAHLHQIYKSYNSQPTAPADWEKAVGTRSSEIYKVQSGDTLSGLSKTLFGDMNFWPKLWSANTFEIENPHEIEPGMSLRFFPGTLAMAPSLSVENTKVADASNPAAANVANDADPVISAKPSKPMAKIPSSLPMYRYKFNSKFSSDLQLTERKNAAETTTLNLSYQLSDEPIVGNGFIKETEMGLNSATDFQYIFVTLPKKSTETHFSVYKNLEILKDPYSEKSVSILEAQGEIEVLEVVNAEENIYRAIVNRTIHPVQVGSVLVPGHLPSFVADQGIPSKGPEARVIGGQYSHSRTLFGDGALIFLNSGTRAGIQEGAFYSVHGNQRTRNENTSAMINDIQVATIKIVQATKEFSTAFVTNVRDYIRVGDHLGKIKAVDGKAEKEMENSLDTGSTGKEPDLDLESETNSNSSSSGSADSMSATGSEDVMPEDQTQAEQQKKKKKDENPNTSDQNPPADEAKPEDDLELK